MNRRSSIVLVLLIMFMVALPAWGQKGHAPKGKPPENERSVVVVNGHGIPWYLYANWYHDQISYQRRLGMDTVMNQATEDSLVLQLIDDELVRQEAARRNINISREDARRSLLNDPPDFIKAPFVDGSGTFHEDVYREVVVHPEKIAQLVNPTMPRDAMVAQWKSDLNKVIDYTQAQMLRSRLMDELLKEKPLTEAMIRARYFAENTRFTGSFIRVLHSTVPDSLVHVAEPEARAWYDSHQEDYRFASARQVAAIILPVVPLPKDSAELKQKIADVRSAVMNAPGSERSQIVSTLLKGMPPNRFPAQPVSLLQVPAITRDALRHAKPGEMIGPYVVDQENIMLFIDDTVSLKDTILRARHVLMKVQEGDTAQEHSIVTLMNALKEKIVSEDVFLQAVHYYSEDGTAKDGGDLGFFRRGGSVAQFDSAAFGAPLNQVVGPVRTRFGYHLIWVNDKVTTGYRIRELRFPFGASHEAMDEARADAAAFARAVQNHTANDSMFHALRAKYPRSVTDTSMLRRLNVYGDALSPANFAFNGETGDIAVITLPYDRVMIARILYSYPTGVAPYEKIRENFVYTHVRRAKQLDYLKPIMMHLRDTLTPEMTVGIIRWSAPNAESFMIQNQPLQSPPDEAVTILDSLMEKTPDGGVSGPVRGTHAYYFLRVIQRQKAPTASDYDRDRAAFTADYRERYRRELLRTMLQKARDYAVVQDLRPGATPGDSPGAAGQR
ncbi:MAG TPA: peptidylprolyl isomerase [Candidatus Kapabacteria bacterium]|nr:peptidylprolyl isomerase [Candidatus Kapabacteria bacterium]